MCLLNRITTTVQDQRLKTPVKSKKKGQNHWQKGVIWYIMIFCKLCLAVLWLKNALKSESVGHHIASLLYSLQYVPFYKIIKGGLMQWKELINPKSATEKWNTASAKEWQQRTAVRFLPAVVQRAESSSHTNLSFDFVSIADRK